MSHRGKVHKSAGWPPVDVRATAAIALLLMLHVAGCARPAPTPEIPWLTYDDGVPVFRYTLPVLTVGISENVISRLDESIVDVPQSRYVALPPQTGSSYFEERHAVLRFTFDVHPASSTEAMVLWDSLTDYGTYAAAPGTVTWAAVPPTVQQYGGNELENFLTGAYPHLNREGFPSVALLHDNGRLGAHAYRYTYDNGHLDQISTFGNSSWIVSDLSVRHDGRTGDLGIVGSDDANAVLARLEAIIRHRVGQGPLFEPAVASCHAVTVLYALRAASLLEDAIPGTPDPVTLLDGPRVQESLAQLTAGNVTVDVRILQLPLDDPMIDALARTSRASVDAGGSSVEPIRLFLHANFDQYWISRPGCEAYLMLILHGDALDDPAMNGRAFHDIADRRIAFAVADLSTRTLKESGPLGFQPEPWPNSLFNTSDNYDVVNWIVVHEVGHLFGLPHPQTRTDGSGESDATTHAVATPMSYAVNDRTLSFGETDSLNWQRHQAILLAVQSLEAGQTNVQGLRLLELGRWNQAAFAYG